MLDREQRLIAVAMRYLELLGSSHPVSIDDMVRAADHDIRDEIRPYLEAVLDTGLPIDIPRLTDDELALARVVIERVRTREPTSTATPRTPSLAALRNNHKLTVRALATQIRLPTVVLAAIERGGVELTTLPSSLITRLAQALGQPEATVQSALATPPPRAKSSIRLRAQDGTIVNDEPRRTFAEIMQTSGASAAEIAEWEEAS
jgi:transcriptional regulator with XRE-family HTH domain